MTDRIIWEHYDRPSSWVPSPELAPIAPELWIPGCGNGPVHGGDPHALVYGIGPAPDSPWLGGRHADLENNVAVLRPWSTAQSIEYCGSDLQTLTALDSDLRRLLRLDEAGRRVVLDKAWASWCDTMIEETPVDDVENAIAARTKPWAARMGLGPLNYDSVEAFESRVHALRQIVRMDPACALRQQCEELLTSWTGTAVELLTTAAVAVGDDDRPEVDEMLGHLEGY